MLIGLTGNIASGKSTVSAMLEQLGAKVIDADRVVHELYAKNIILKLKLLLAFGLKAIGFRHLAVNRHGLAGIVFNDKKQMEKLESIVWPYVRNRIAGLEKTNELLVVEAALLFESGMDQKMDKTIIVCAGRDAQLKRLLKRGLCRPDALRRIESQLSQKKKAGKADYVISNNSSFKSLEKQVNRLWIRIKPSGKPHSFYR
ncbi:MAG TPA: dephospho-CoA kinase [Nanoarchaeota archaeon]|nr:dephospho-CoA kinase [Nanoarchaeota archaeon]